MNDFSDGVLTEFLIIGSAGQAGVIVDILEACRHTIAGYLDDTAPAGVLKRGYPILGRLADRGDICLQRGIRDIVIAVGDNWWRRKLCNDMKTARDLRYPVVAHPTATIAQSSQIAEGSVLMARANVGPHSRVGKFAIVNTGASLDHDCVLNDFASLAPGVFTGGLVEIGECSAIGVGAALSDRIKIGSHTVVGTGAVVVRDIPDLCVAYGNPAAVIRSRAQGEPYHGRVRVSSM